MKEAEFLGAVLVESPVMHDILEGLRERYLIPEIEGGRDPLKQRIMEAEERGGPLDWEGVRQDLSEQVRAISDLLPPQLRMVEKIIQARESLRPEPEFTEPVTEKLRADVTALYHAYVKLVGVLADIVAGPWQTAIKSCYSAIVDNAFEYLYTGSIRDVPQDWITAVRSVPLFGEEVIMVLAGRMADPGELAEELREKMISTFGKHTPKLTTKNLPFAKYSAMRLREIPFKEIADQYVSEHPKALPKDPESRVYQVQRRRLEERLEKMIHHHLVILERMVGEENR